MAGVNINPNTGQPYGEAVIVDETGGYPLNVNSAGQAQVEDIEQAGYVALTSPPTNTNAAADTALAFPQQVNRLILQNTSSQNVYYDFDQTASTASFVLQPGAFLSYPKKHTNPHLYTVSAVPLNAANGILVRGAM